MADILLWHIRLSNFNEKARWALDHKRVAHVRRASQGGQHQLVALALTRGRRRTLPLLRIDGQVIADSTAIIAELERRFPDPPLYPADADELRRALELEDFFDESYGHEVRRLAFWNLLHEDEDGLATARDLLGVRSRQVAGVVVPGMRAWLFRHYGIDEDSVEVARERVHAGFDRIESERAGGEYLVGERFSVADLTACALVAPTLGIPEFRGIGEAMRSHPGIVRVRRELSRHPATEWVRGIYAAHRLPEARKPAGAAAGV